MIERIDTTGQFFKPPANVGSYSAWLEASYHANCWPEGDNTVCAGTAQEINRLIYLARHKNMKLIATGLYAREAAETIMKLAEQTITVEVAA